MVGLELTSSTSLSLGLLLLLEIVEEDDAFVGSNNEVNGELCRVVEVSPTAGEEKRLAPPLVGTTLLFSADRAVDSIPRGKPLARLVELLKKGG